MSTHWQKETHKNNISSLISNSKANKVKNYIFQALKTNNYTPRLLVQESYFIKMLEK